MSMMLLLVEDNFDLAQTIVQYLEMENITCDHAASGEAGLSLTREREYDILILDISLPRMTGLDLCKQLRQEGKDTPVLMLTARDTLDDKLAGFESGTDDYLIKPFDMEELIARIHALAKRRSGQARVLRFLDITLELDSKSAFRGERQLNLTPTGWIILETLIREHPAVVSRQRLMQAVWGDELPESNSLKVHLHNLRKELDPNAKASVIQTLQNQGYLLKDSQ